MKRIGKIIFGIVLMGVISAAVAMGTYSYMSKNNPAYSSGNHSFDQTGYRAVGMNYAAENTDFTLAAEQSVNGVVHIKSIMKAAQRGNEQRYNDLFEYFFGQSPRRQVPQERVGFGSGVIISTDGYIVTNNHVIEGADEIEITTNHDEVYKAKLIGGDAATDIALLKIEGKNFPVIPFGDSDALKIGEWVLAVGNPFNLTSTVTAGIVSATGRANLMSSSRRNPYGYGSQSYEQAEKIQSYIQTDAAVNPGNSGGALVNTKGELVGINTMIYSETGNFVGYSFAVPVSIVQKVVSDIKQYGMVQRALIGVSVQDMSVLKETDPEKYEKLKVHEGVYVAGFSSNSSAKSAGIEEGDVITGINGAKIRNYTELKAQLSRYSPGNKVDVQVQRGDKTRTFSVELKNDQGTTEAIKHRTYSEILGATFNELSSDMKRKVGINYGLEVTNVTNGKLKQVGVKDGFIILTANDNRLTTSDELEKIVTALLKQDPDDRGLFIKGFYPNGKMEYIAVDLNN